MEHRLGGEEGVFVVGDGMVVLIILHAVVI